MKIRAALCLTWLLTGMLLSACNLHHSEEIAAVEQAGNIQTWIDAPLDGSTIPLASYEIVLHVFDPAEVRQVELSANGSLLANLPNPDPGKQLATLKYFWRPASPGNYMLKARAQSAGGDWSSEAVAVVTVSDFTMTPVITTTASVTPTSTLTATLTVTSTVAELSFTPQISTSTFYYGACGSDQVTIQVQVPGDNVYSVVIFTNVKDQAGGGTTGWDEGSSMNPTGGGWFSRTISSRSVAGADRFKNAWLLYQFVASDRSNQIIGRSQIYSDITLAACGAAQPPVMIDTITPTQPGIIPPPRIRVPSATLIPPPK